MLCSLACQPVKKGFAANFNSVRRHFCVVLGYTLTSRPIELENVYD